MAIGSGNLGGDFEKIGGSYRLLQNKGSVPGDTGPLAKPGIARADFGGSGWLKRGRLQTWHESCLSER
jgi:hypothetical protein